MLLALVSSGVRADLKEYLSKPEPAYKWEKIGVKEIGGAKVYELHLVSQTWQGMNWEHKLELFIPEKVKNPNFCALLNTGGNGGQRDTLLGVTFANESGQPFAILYGIPKQPLYGGLTEDALIVYTWKKYVETGDESWPLHFPMAKACLKAMDALQAFTKQEGISELNQFMITGASKRGWTTWLAGASKDPRIKGIAPMVIDVLNVPAQTKHQVESYGKLSEQVGDYSAGGIDQLLASPKGKRLMELEDPYSYRDILTLPKLILLGTNDRYWSQDSLNIYWDDLKGPKWVIYVPNSGHGLEDRGRVVATLSAFIRMLAGGAAWPKMDWKWTATGNDATINFNSNIPAKSFNHFMVDAPTLDFRDSKWTSFPIDKAVSKLGVTTQAPATGNRASFVEAVYEIDGKRFTLSTQLRILKSGK